MIPMFRVLSRAYLRGIWFGLFFSAFGGGAVGTKMGPVGPVVTWNVVPGCACYRVEVSMARDLLVERRAQLARTHRRRRGNIAEELRTDRPVGARRDGTCRTTKRRSTAALQGGAAKLRLALPAVMSEGLVGLRHAVDVVLALVGGALLRLRVEQLIGKPLRHRLLAALACELDEPADSERAGATRWHLDGHLVRRTADAAGANLERRRERLDRSLELLDRISAGALADDRERVVDDPLGGRLLAVEHHAVDDLLDEAGAMDRVRLDRPDGGCCAARHYLAFTPYWERAFLRSLTPAASSVPRTTL